MNLSASCSTIPEHFTEEQRLQDRIHFQNESRRWSSSAPEHSTQAEVEEVDHPNFSVEEESFLNFSDEEEDPSSSDQ